MRVVSHGLFDGYQQILAEEIIRALKFELERVEAPADLVMQLTGSIAFAVTSLIDGTAGIERDGEQVSPLLTFVVGEEELESAGGNSWMHEYVYRLLPNVFASSSSDDTSDSGDS